MNKFKELSNTKRVLKCQLTKLSNKITATILDADNVAIEQFKSNVTELKIEIKKVFSALVNLCENDDEVDSYISESNDIYDQLEELTLKLVRNAYKISSSSKFMSECTDVKLPKLSIPVFSGNMEEWLSFADLFQASVINNTKLSPGQKLQYLKGCLADKALRIVQSLTITDANFQIAWNLLCERYCNRRELVFSLLKRIINLPVLHSDNYEQLLSTVDVVKEVIRSLENMKCKTEGVADTVFVFLIQTKLDSVTNSWWERSLEGGDSIPTVDQLLKFLMVQARCVHADNSVQRKHSPRFSALLSEIKFKCSICQNNHQLFKCRVFQTLSTQERVKFVKSHNLCFNCLSQNHRVNACESKNHCQLCGMHHHSLLHYENRSSPPRFVRKSISTQATSSHPTREISESSSEIQSQETITTELPSSSSQHFSSCLSDFSMKHQVLLCTAVIAVRDTSGGFQYCRALLDPGSQTSFVTEDCVHRLGIPKREAKVQVSCLGSGDTQTNGVIEVNFSPHFLHEHIFSTSAFVIKNIIGNLPHFNIGIHVHKLFNNLQLADPYFHKSSSIDILLGVDISLPMFLGESISKGEGVPLATNSKLGWIVSGTVSCVTHQNPRIVVNNIQCETEELMKKFWEMEEINCEKIWSSDEHACGKHFQSTHSRSDDGRYIVRHPFTESTTRLGQSKQQAAQQFKRSEKTFVSSPDWLTEYTTFMDKYTDLNHMEKLSTGDVLNHPSNSNIFYSSLMMGDSRYGGRFSRSSRSSSRSTIQKNFNEHPVNRDRPSRGRVRSRDMLPLRNRVFVSNIPFECRWVELTDLFREKVGEVAFVELMEDKGKSNGTAIVELKDSALMKKAIDVMHKFEFKGRLLNVKEDVVPMDRGRDLGRANMRSRSLERDHVQDDMSFRDRGNQNYRSSAGFETYGLNPEFLRSISIQGPLTTKISISNLDYKVTEKKLEEIFKLAGKLSVMELKLDNEGKSKGHAIGEYEHPLEAVQAISMFNGQKLFARVMSVRMDKFADDEPSSKLPSGLHGVGKGLGVGGLPMQFSKNSSSTSNGSNFGLGIGGSSALGMNSLTSMLSSESLSDRGLMSSTSMGLSSGLGTSSLSLGLGGVSGRSSMLSSSEMRNIDSISRDPFQLSPTPRDRNYRDSYERSNNDSFSSPTISDTVLLGNIPSNFSWSVLRDRYRDLGDIRYADMKGQSTAVLRFGSAQEAQRAVDIINSSRTDTRSIQARLY